MARLWNDRLMWSGEIPLDFPDLNPVAALRFDNENLSAGTWPDAVTPSRTWRADPWIGSPNAQIWADWAGAIRLNSVNPSADQGVLSLDHFTGLWPSSGKLMMSLWMRQNYTMTHNPLITSRDGPGQPIGHLATTTAAAFRHQVYSETGTLLSDTLESHGWGSPMGWVWMAQLIDMDARSTQLVAVDRETGRSYMSPLRTFSGEVNPSSVADVHVFGMHNGSWYTGGNADEVFISHPGPDFNLAEMLERVRLGIWADARNEPLMDIIEVTDNNIRATSEVTFQTGAEAVSWDREPNFIDRPTGATWHLSSDGGETWTSPSALPETFTGHMRWTVPLLSQEVFSGIDLIVPTAPMPTIGPITDVEIQQNSSATRTMTYTVSGTGTWGVQHSGVADIQQSGNVLTITSGWEIGTDVVTVTLTDEYLQTATRTFALQVSPADAPPPDVPIYPRAPIILWDDNGPSEVLAYPLSGVILKETDGEDTLTFEVFADDEQNRLIKHEEFVTCAGETYRIRRITDVHSGSTLLKTVYCEALFYDLATTKQIDGREWEQTTAGEAMQFALAGTGWSVGVANVSTLRSYEHEDTNPLEFLRFIRQHHGGELIFDNENKTVSLLTSYGRRTGVTFFYGHGLADSKRVVDTTSLVTRIYAQNADGVTIASVNNGLDYVEDFSFTDELKVAVYDFKSGTSPYTMLSMATATLGNRAQPDISYEVTVDDLSAETGREIDRFNVRDYVRVVDESIGLNAEQRVVGLEYDVVRPWNSQLTLGSKLREMGSGTEIVDAGTLTTGAGVSTFDLVPFNLLLNGRFDTAFAHWARFGVEVEKTNQGTSDYSAVFRGPGERWIEQTVQPDNRPAYALSLDVESSGGPQNWVPNVVVSAVVTYEDGSSETIEIDVA